MQSFFCNAGSLSAIKEGIISGQLPRKLIVACVRNDAYNGVNTLNPFTFTHFNCSHIKVSIDGQSNSIPALELDYAHDLFIKWYHSLFGGVGKINTDEDFDVSRTEYNKGFA